MVRTNALTRHDGRTHSRRQIQTRMKNAHRRDDGRLICDLEDRTSP
jgi:hypothetical protein